MVLVEGYIILFCDYALSLTVFVNLFSCLNHCFFLHTPKQPWCFL